MTGVRQDAWTKEEDELLANVVLQYIREGGTQLEAFAEVGGACRGQRQRAGSAGIRTFASSIKRKLNRQSKNGKREKKRRHR